MGEKKDERRLVGLRCPRCFSRLIYYKVRKREFQCRFCGNTFTMPHVEERGD